MPAKVLESMDDFTGHSGSASGGGGILSWKDDGEGQVDVVLHTKAPIYALYSSSWYEIGVDRETNKPKLFFTRFNSMEDEKVLRSRRFRARDDKEAESYKHRYPWQKRGEEKAYIGLRQYPPVVCPMSLLIEWVREQCEVGDLGITDKIFEFDTGEDGVVIHAGCFCGIIGGKEDDFSEAELKSIRQAKIKISEAFKEDASPRMQYVMVAIDYSAVESGPQVLIESQSLGDKLKKLIKDRKEDLGADEGDPKKHPVVFRFTFDGDKDFSAKYDAKVRTKADITPEILEAVTGPWPEEKVGRIVNDSNLVTLRRSFEQHWCHKKLTPPWADIFKAAEELMKGTPAMQAPDEADSKKGDKKAKDENEGDNDGASDNDEDGSDDQSSNEDDEGSDEDDDLVECVHCHEAMPETADTCPKCGATYDEDGNMTPPKAKEEAKKPMRKRGEAAAGKAPTRSKS